MNSSPIDINTIYASYQTPEIDDFLQTCKLFNEKKRQWFTVKRRARKPDFVEQHLYMPFQDIIAAILKHFHKSPSRAWVTETHEIPMKHNEGVIDHKVDPDGTQWTIKVKTSPDLSILGSGPCFLPLENRRPGYDHCISPVEIKRHEDLQMDLVTVQVGVYARQCFMHQPHRRYLASVVLTEDIVILFVYDRSGVLTSQKIDIHGNAETFVRIIIGISSVTDSLEHSPFDNRLTWYSNMAASSCASGEKPAPPVHEIYPVIKVKNGLLPLCSVPEEYRVTKNIFHRSTIVGRGTICCKAESVINDRLVKVLIKDSWRAAGLPSEWELRDFIKDLPGVGQIFACEEDKDCRISDFRNFIFDGLYENNSYKQDRIFTRLVLEAYGQSIQYFMTKIQLLEAFRDAVAGHKYLWLSGILHRDVSIDNILLGVEGAPEGYRGMLIDFDLALNVSDPKNSFSQIRAGTRAFQSIAMLRSARWGSKAPPQDHLDDLESYFYVLAWICHQYDGPNVSLSPAFLNKWELEDSNDCGSFKKAFLGSPITDLPAYFDTPIFKKLLKGLARLCEGYVTAKNDAVEEGDADFQFPSLADIHKADVSKGAPEHDKFLALIDAAIEAERTEKELNCPDQCKISDVPQAVAQAPEVSKPVNHPGANLNTSVPGPLAKKRRAPDAVAPEAQPPTSKQMKKSGAVSLQVKRRSPRLAMGNQ